MSGMAQELGLRERKKEKTRQLIADTAGRLFSERGFDSVSVAEIAREAEVSEATVFNYFPTKEDLVYQGMEVFEAQMLDAVCQRPAGESVLEAFGRFATEPRGLLAAEGNQSAKALLSGTRMITASPALLARERQILVGYTGSLADLLADETGASPTDLRPLVAASALVGLHSALIGYVRQRLLDTPDVDIRRLARDLRREGAKAVDLLRGGLDGYAVKPAPTRQGGPPARRPPAGCGPYHDPRGHAERARRAAT
jgi:AcrR family transcriptional regulator